MEINFHEFIASINNYVREDEETGMITDSRAETAKEIIKVFDLDILCEMEICDIAAIFSYALAVDPKLSKIHLMDEKMLFKQSLKNDISLLSAESGSPSEILINNLMKSRKGKMMLVQIAQILCWAKGQNDIRILLYKTK